MAYYTIRYQVILNNQVSGYKTIFNMFIGLFEAILNIIYKFALSFKEGHSLTSLFNKPESLKATLMVFMGDCKYGKYILK